MSIGAVLSMVLCACGNGDAEVDAGMRQATVEQSVSDQLEEQFGVAPDAIDCPGDLAGKVDTTMRCKLMAGSDVLGVTLTVTSVENNRIKFDVAVDEQ